MRVEVWPGDTGWNEMAPLVALVYPPDILATIVWRDVTWAHADRRVLVYEGERLVSTVSIYFRNGLLGAASIRIGGIGGVMTHPAHRGCGFASAAMRRADLLFQEDGSAFSVLFCEPKNFAFYRRLGWQIFAGDVMVDQPGGRMKFTVMTPMMRGVTHPSPIGGVVDLCGLPW